MKQIFKLIPVALGLLTLASCSNEDFLGENNDVQYGANDLEVKLGEITDEESSTTRGALYKFTEADREIVFDTEDKIRVYDENFGQYDLYTFGSGKFTKTAGKGVTAKWGLFPSKYVKYGNYDVETEKTTAVVEIPEVITYDESSEVAYKEDVAYVSEIPFFGEATMAGDHLATTLNALTALYKIQLNSVKGNYKWMKISSKTMPLSGLFEATLNDEKPALTASANLATKNYIIVDLKSVPSSRSIIYVPIIPGTYPQNDFKVQFSNADDWTADDAWTTPADQDKTYNAEAGVTFTVRSIKPLTRSFNMSLTTCEALSRQLNSDKSMTGAVEYTITKLAINRNEDESDYTIYVPNMKANSLTIGVTDLENNLGSEQKLVIKHADAKDPYTKKVVLNVAGITNASSSKTPVEIDLPECDVQIIGDYTHCSNITIKNAKSLTFGDGTTATPIKGTTTLKITDEDGKSTIAESLTIAENATVGQDIALGTDVKNTFMVNIGGDISKNILSVYRATTNVTGKGKVQTLRSMGDVTIEGTRSDFAVGNLYLNGTEQNVDLRSGIVLTIGTQSETANRTATVNNEETGATYIGSISGNDKITITLGTSKWAGKKLTGSYADKKNIYTASMLASITGSSAESYVLQNNIDLNGSAEGRNWTSVDLKSAFDGNKKTISNLKSTTGGLFNVDISSAADIKDLTIKNPTIELATASEDGIGVLANTVKTNKLTVTNVKATNIAITGKDATSKVGGLIGTNISEVDLKGVSTTGTIAGYSMLGGLIGYAGAAVTIQKQSDSNKSTSAVTISANYNSKEDYDLNYATVGKFIGSMNKDAEIKMTDVTVGTTGFTHDTGEFKGKILYPVVTSGKVTGKEVKFGQDLIGYSGDVPISEKVTINGEDKKYPSFATKKTYTDALGETASILYLYYIDK